MAKRSQHPDALIRSDWSDGGLCRAVDKKFRDLAYLYEKIKGVPLIPPPDLTKAVFLWRRVFVRHKAGDFRNSRTELLAMREVAEWTLRENAKLRNQEEIPKVDWRD